LDSNYCITIKFRGTNAIKNIKVASDTMIEGHSKISDTATDTDEKETMQNPVLMSPVA